MSSQLNMTEINLIKLILVLLSISLAMAWVNIIDLQNKIKKSR